MLDGLVALFRLTMWLAFNLLIVVLGFPCALAFTALRRETPLLKRSLNRWKSAIIAGFGTSP